MILGLLDIGPVIAQSAFDPTSAGLLNGGSSPEPDDLDSSRFKKVDKPAAETKKAKGAPEPASQKSSVKATTKPSPTPSPMPSPTPSPTLAPTKGASIPDQMRNLIMGGNSDDIEAFRKQIHPDDRRNNHIELNFGPAYFYNNSTSNFSIRRFTSEGPAAEVGATGWLSPFFGIHADYFTALEASVDSNGPKQSVPLDVQNVEIGVRFRKHFGITRKAASINWGVDYIDRREKVPNDTIDRVSTDTSGLSLSLQADIPTSAGYAHIIGVEFAPRLVHIEESGNNVHSGGKNDTDEIGAWVGGKIIFDRQNQIYWTFKQTLEQNTFDGQASAIDPKTGVAPDGVSITNSMSIFSIGYSWGD